MANLGLRGERWDSFQAVTCDADCTPRVLAKISDASTNPPTVTVCGAGEAAIGVYTETLDISADGARSQIVKTGLVLLTAAAAITDASLPVKAAASGQVTPVTTDLDYIVGKPTHTCDSGDLVQVDLSLLGSYYGV